MPALLLLLFAGSGCAALIYEIVWLQLLQLVIGSTAVSIAALLATFMGGMCLGSVSLARVVRRAANPMRVFALLEAGTGICGAAALFGLPLIQGLYVSFARAGTEGLLLRGALCCVCLLPPTVLMGATLPAVSRAVDHSTVGFLYAANIAGGVIGCVAAGFWLLRVFDMGVATYVAVGLNLSVAAFAWIASRPTGSPVPERDTAPLDAGGAWGIYVAIALSGLSALGAEAVWTRLLALTLGPTVYTFSIILAVFLIGMGVGSAAGSVVARDACRARRNLALTQAALMAAIGWAAYMIARQLPYWDKNLFGHDSVWIGFLHDFGSSAIAILPAALCWGASFPLALASIGEHSPDAAEPVGKIYACNTLGAIAGAVCFGIAAIPLFGSQISERLLVAVAATGAFAALERVWRWRAALATAALAFLWIVPPTPWQLLAFGRRLPLEAGKTDNGWRRLYSAEGINSSIVYTEFVDHRRFFHVAGKIEASSSPADMQLQRSLGHIPALLHANPKSVLIVGCGAGVTAGSFTVHPELEHITLCEIEPLIPPASARFFAKENHNVMRDPRTRIVYDDARHFALTAREKFDIITSDPIHPWVKGAATLYTKEYFEACKAHLNPGGLVTQWVPLYESDLATVQSEIATFFDVFPHGIVWGNPGDFNEGYDVVLMGSNDPLRIDLDAAQHRLDAAPALATSLREAGFHSAAELFGTYAASANDLLGWLAHAEINRDRSLRLQYLAGLARHEGKAGAIYGEIVKRGGFPQGLFTGSESQMEKLRGSFESWRADPFESSAKHD
ncbi:MAG TPA: fused MFS/spermidine synthase [Bryobacteraceae bacterium]|nr:fused MFS/spermidine synthase [Bryobacteraceae bacterium]